MSARFVRNLLFLCCLLVTIAPAAGLAEDTGQDVAIAPASFASGDCAVSPLKSESTPEQVPALPVFEPEKTWSSANPCFVSCPNGGFIDCTWSWAGDPTYCCWKSATRCQSYNCNTGALVLSKVCLGF
jgi:hypothetical protein